ncbi:hypothetical protein EDB81DRAFT_124813 [Dactylonectria macrodidyma]|uniref:Uncharacterized protein n=1 Tax=Dactylonectria macrodidyma TaxID=307937 RepID=A0A9P9E8W6_9HYPO|nr:hypothetical protein EDB81DRAFT_124813 [Dactylonectria macrodidyma]
MDPMGGHCNNGPLANARFLSYLTYPPPPPPLFDYMSPCHRTPDFWAGLSVRQPLPRSRWAPPPASGARISGRPVPDSSVYSIRRGQRRAGSGRLKEVSAAKTSSAALQGQHVHQSQPDASLECLNEHDRMIVVWRKREVSWDQIRGEYEKRYKPVTVDALRMRLSRLKNKHSWLRQAFLSKACPKGRRQSQRKAEPEESKQTHRGSPEGGLAWRQALPTQDDSNRILKTLLLMILFPVFSSPFFLFLLLFHGSALRFFGSSVRRWGIMKTINLHPSTPPFAVSNKRKSPCQVRDDCESQRTAP